MERTASSRRTAAFNALRTPIARPTRPATSTVTVARLPRWTVVRAAIRLRRPLRRLRAVLQVRPARAAAWGVLRIPDGARGVSVEGNMSRPFYAVLFAGLL